MVYSDKITFVIFTYNEEARIERVIQNISGWARILIIDNHSTDATREIAERLGAEVFLNKNNGWFEDYDTIQRIQNRVETPWLYWGFTDELLDYETLSIIIQAVESGKYKIVNIARKNYYYGRFCHNAYADRLNRVFEKNAIDFRGNVIHGFGKAAVPEDKILFLNSKKYFVKHFISNTAKQYLATIDRYTDIQAVTNKKCSGLNLVARIFKAFIMQYIFHGAYKAGKAGLFLVLQMMYYQCILAMKTHEREHGLSFTGIEELNNVERDAILLQLKNKSV